METMANETSEKSERTMEDVLQEKMGINFRSATNADLHDAIRRLLTNGDFDTFAAFFVSSWEGLSRLLKFQNEQLDQDYNYLVEGIKLALSQPRKEVTVQFTLGPNAIAPRYATDEAAGADLFAAEAVTVLPGSRRIVQTGIKASLPAGYEIQIRSRSGLAAKQGLVVLNSPGTVDSDYRGDISVILFNTGEQPVEVKVGDRIAQAVVQRIPQALWEHVETLDETARGENGFGSTGV